jgi:hypothetical protein
MWNKGSGMTTRCPLPTFTAVTYILVDITVVEQSIAANSGEWYVKAIHSPILSPGWSTGSMMESPPKNGYFPHF